MAEALRSMALGGHGIAWLPRSLVAPEIRAGALTTAAPSADGGGIIPQARPGQCYVCHELFRIRIVWRVLGRAGTRPRARSLPLTAIATRIEHDLLGDREVPQLDAGCDGGQGKAPRARPRSGAPEGVPGLEPASDGWVWAVAAEDPPNYSDAE
jgi:hypothetical protein